MAKEQQKDKIIEIVKKAIDDNSVTTYGVDDMVSIDGDDVDHIAEEVAENVMGIAFDRLQEKYDKLKDERDEYYAQADRLQARNADLKRTNEAIQRATAKEILQQMWDWKDRGTPFIADVQELADRYGVEVEE